MGWKIAWIVSLALLLFTGFVGLYNGLTEWGEGRTAVQRSVTISVLLYGVFGLLTAYGLIRRRPWSVKTGIVWAIAATYAPGVAVMAYGGEGAMIGSASGECRNRDRCCGCHLDRESDDSQQAREW